MPIHHTVAQGECLTSIGHRYGIPWTKIWNHPENSGLRGERKDPNVIYPGDVLYIPELEPKEVARPTEQKHRFRMKGSPVKFKVRLLINDEPLANKPYKLEVDGQWTEGTTDGDGFVEQPLRPDAQTGKIILDDGTMQDIFELSFGTLDPIETDEGVAGRLIDLGYPAGSDLAGAVLAFQQKEGLEATGRVDDATRARLKERFGQ